MPPSDRGEGDLAVGGIADQSSERFLLFPLEKLFSVGGEKESLRGWSDIPSCIALFLREAVGVYCDPSPIGFFLLVVKIVHQSEVV